MNRMVPLHPAVSLRSSTEGWTGAPSGGPSKPQTPVLPEVEEQVKAELATPWHVIIFNDPVNLMNYVSMVIQRIFGYPEQKARLMMLDVHRRGKCIVWTGEKERAEMYVRELQGHQLLSAMRKAEV